MTISQGINLEELQVFEAAQPIDVSKYEGRRAKIDKCDVVDTFTSYNEDGKWVDGLKRPVKKLLVSSEILEIINRDNKSPIELRASSLFSLKEKIIDGKVIWGVSNSLRSNLWKFMKKQKVNTIIELKGTMITVTTRSSNNPEDDREFLGIVTQ